MFKANCATCGKECEVPFRPSGDKPIYCKDHFVPQGPVHEKGGGRPFVPRRDFGAPSFTPRENNTEDTKRILSDINYKLDKLISLMSSNVQAPKVKPKVPEADGLKKALSKALKPKKATKKKKK